MYIYIYIHVQKYMDPIHKDGDVPDIHIRHLFPFLAHLMTGHSDSILV